MHWIFFFLIDNNYNERLEAKYNKWHICSKDTKFVNSILAAANDMKEQSRKLYNMKIFQYGGRW